MSKLTKDVGCLGLGRVASELEVVLQENVEPDVPEEQKLLHLGEGDWALLAGGARQQHDGLGHAGVEGQVGGVADGVEGVLVVSGLGLEVLDAQEDLVAGVEDLAFHGVGVGLGVDSLASVSHQGVACRCHA